MYLQSLPQQLQCRHLNTHQANSRTQHRPSRQRGKKLQIRISIGNNINDFINNNKCILMNVPSSLISDDSTIDSWCMLTIGTTSDVSNSNNFAFTFAWCPTSKICSLTDSRATYILRHLRKEDMQLQRIKCCLRPFSFCDSLYPRQVASPAKVVFYV